MASVISIISDIRKMLETMEVQLKNGEHVGDIIASIKNTTHILERQCMVIDDGNDYRLKSTELELQFARQTVELLNHRLRSKEHLLRKEVLDRDMGEEKDQAYENGDRIVQTYFVLK